MRCLEGSDVCEAKQRAVRLPVVVFVLHPHHGHRAPPLNTNMSNDTRRERLTTITRLLFPSYEVAAVEWLFNMRALYSLAAARFGGDTTQALRWLEPAFAELTPASLLFAIRTRMPLEATSATTHLADRITTLTAHFFPGSSEYNAYLWLNDVAKLAELARLVREGDLPATFAWIAPAMDLAAEVRSATNGLVTPAPESEEQLLDVWKEDFRVWRDEFSMWQHAYHTDRVSQAPYPPIIIQAPLPFSGPRGLTVRNPSASPRRSESSVGGHDQRSRSRSRSPVATSQAPTSVLPTMAPPPGIQAPVNIFMPPPELRFGTEGDGHPPSRTRTRRSFSPGGIYIGRDGREYRMEPVLRRCGSRSPSYDYEGRPRQRYDDAENDRGPYGDGGRRTPGPTIIMAPSSQRTQSYGDDRGPRTHVPTIFVPESRSGSPSGRHYDDRAPTAPHTIIMPDSSRRGRSRSPSSRHYDDRAPTAPHTIIMPDSSRRGRSRSPSHRHHKDRHHDAPPPTILMQTAPSGRRSRSRSSSRRRYGDRRPDAPQTIIMGTAPSGRRSRSRSPGGRYYEDREHQPTTIINRRYDDDGRRSWTHSRPRAAPELPLVDGGRPDIITATVKSAAVRGKPSRPKRARTALASLAGK
jgi:hypothetical protein